MEDTNEFVMENEENNAQENLNDTPNVNDNYDVDDASKNMENEVDDEEDVVSQQVEIEPDNPLDKKKRKRTSKVWEEFNEITLPGGQRKVECTHCKKKLGVGNTGATTQYKRHLERCVARVSKLRKQTILHFQSGDSNTINSGNSSQVGGSILTTFKYDHIKVREMIAHYILLNEKPFSIVEEFGFNLIMKSMSPYYVKYSRATSRSDVMLVYEKEKKKLKNMLKSINRISFTTDLWKSKNQRISYMTVTAHYVDSTWKLQKRVLSFLHLPPPHTATEIVDSFYKALVDWGVEDKVFTISVDNASNNDRAIRLLKDSFRIKKKLFFGGKLFHVRCCAHILNLMVKDGIKAIEHVVDKIRDTVSFVNASESRLMKFADVVQQLQLPTRKLVMDCPTRWNSTYTMLTIALQLREAFFSYSDREVAYVNSTYTMLTIALHLFLSQICTIKKVLDDGVISFDNFICDMTIKMKQKFDKYWGECNLLMAFGAIMDPRMKFVVIEFAFPKIYIADESMTHISHIRTLLYELYEEYAISFEPQVEGLGDTFRPTTSSPVISLDKNTTEAEKFSGWHDFTTYVIEKTSKRPMKSDLDNYLGDGLEICPEGQKFDVIAWWKNNQMKYRILSRMAVDILSIPISTVASESTFSAGERVVDTYRSKLGVDAVQALICGSNWLRAFYGMNGSIKGEGDDDEVEIHLPTI